ncbi:MAG: hypothetical protein JSS07_06940 [Proteobacteria bacterium]|nr:hypothetical protein [Pseudomonadota bacterium]
MNGKILNSSTKKNLKNGISEELRQKLYVELQGIAANCVINPSFASASALQKFGGGDENDYWELILALDNQVKNVNAGDLKAIEGVLTAQIHILNNMFNKLAVRALKQEHMKLLEPFMRLALKAQSQCRVTAETLANIKNPLSSTVVKQANIGYNQQVNNGASVLNP